MYKFIPSFIISVLFINGLIAQTVEPSSSVAKNLLQIELESLYTIQKEKSIKLESISIPSALFRFGITHQLELQLNTPIIKERLWENDHLIHSLNKFDDIQVGFSINLWQEKNWIPEASLMIRAILPTDSKFEIHKVGKLCSFNLSNTLTNKLTFNSNIGYAENTDNSKSGFYIANFTFEASSKIHFFIENFGDFNHQKLISHNLNLGGGYNFNQNFVVDISIANGINHHMFYVGGIITYAFEL